MQEPEEKEVTKQADVIVLADQLITINGEKYNIVEDHDGGFDKEKVEERYNTVLDKYDFIVGDWGYDQLRFKGFYEDERKESGIDNRISHLEDYLIEYCNFGCAYFVLEKEKKTPIAKRRRSQQRGPHKQNGKIHANHNSNHSTNHKKTNNLHAPKIHKNKKRPVTHNKKKTNSPTKTRNFKIRKIGEKS
ncbi:YutD family protein [Companilactobacillus jidongensis]|uniref:YutD family protein n=1 Tax=Companilactobacillus jidongensis TaxID=2486006 RepID=UPI001CDC196A|nr:YutD family protein [Companilactobacillus jidongensis]